MADDARVLLALALCRECFSFLLRLGILYLVLVLGKSGFEAADQVMFTMRIIALQRIEEAQVNVRIDSLAVELAKLPPRKRYKFHPDTK